jgi:hypothetical protein
VWKEIAPDIETMMERLDIGAAERWTAAPR